MRLNVAHRLKGTVAHSVRWLYVYAAVNVLFTIIGIIRLIIVQIPILPNDGPLSPTQERVIVYSSVAFGIALQLAAIIYLITAKNVKHVLVLLKILLGLELLGLLVTVFKPTPFIVLSIAQTIFTFVMIRMLQGIDIPATMPGKPSKGERAPATGHQKQAASHATHQDLLIAGSVVAVLVVGVLLFSEYARYEYKTNVLHAHSFTSSKYHFTVDFPGKPSSTVYTSHMGCTNDSFPYTEYSSSIDKGTQVFTIDAQTWPVADAEFVNMDQSALKASLSYILNDDMQASNAHLVRTDYVYTSPGHTLAKDATFTRKGNGFTATGFERVFAIGNTDYEIITQGSDNAAFTFFADSFRYTGAKYHRTSNFSSSSLDAACVEQDSSSGSTADQPTDVPTSETTANQPSGVPTIGTVSNGPSGVPTNGTISNSPTN